MNNEEKHRLVKLLIDKVSIRLCKTAFPLSKIDVEKAVLMQIVIMEEIEKLKN